MSRHPNILLVISHDIGNRLGCSGCRDVRSPHLDAIAAAGARCARAYCTHPQCSPARASLTTGRHPHANGVMGLTHRDYGWDLHHDEVHLAAWLHDHGYRTTGIGSIHETQRPEAFGFERVLRRGPDVGPLADSHVDAAIADLHAARDDGRPWYCQLALFEGHRLPGSADGPFGPMPSDPVADAVVPPFLQDTPEAREEIAAQNGAIRFMDRELGRLFAELEAQGMAEDTIVVFAADHGIPFPRAKTMCYDPGIEIALLLRGPGVAPGGVIDDLVSGVDLMPTLLDLAGLPHPPRMQGISFAPQARGERGTPRGAVFVEQTWHNYADPVRGIRTHRHKLLVNGMPCAAVYNATQQWAPRTRPVFPADPKSGMRDLVELFDLEADPVETRNLADDPAHAALRDELLARLAEHAQQTDDPLLHGLPMPPRFTRMQGLLAGTNVPA